MAYHTAENWSYYFTSWTQITPNARTPPPPGQPLNSEDIKHLETKGIYFERELGSGDFGSVWLTKLTKTVYDEHGNHIDLIRACKILSLRAYSRKQLVTATKELLNEADIQSQLDHPHLVKCDQMIYLEDRSGSNFPFLYILMFMEVCSDTLANFAHRRRTTLTEQQSLKWFVQIADAIRYLHYDRRIAHSDIKLSNILIFRNPANKSQVLVKLADFGLSRQFEEDIMTPLGKQLHGTKGYMAPEISNTSPYNVYLTDVYALGISLMETLTRYVPSSVLMIQMVEKIQRISNQFSLSKMFGLSKSLINLLKGMICADPRKRFEINKVYFHEWTCQQHYTPGMYITF